MAFLTLLLFCVGVSGAAAQNRERAPETPRDHYNQGLRLLREGNLREAELALQTAVASNQELVQPSALYNLGHVRFLQGLQALKDLEKGEAVQRRSRASVQNTEAALQMGQAALNGTDLNAIVSAYRNGKGARKDIKAVLEAVKRAMESHSAVLLRWQRAAGDFKSAYELNPADTEAKTNGDIMDQQIAKLVDFLQQMQMSMMSMKGQRDQLQKMMTELKGRMPQDSEEAKEGNGDEEEEQDKPKEPQQGDQEAPAQDGKEMVMTREEAMRLLEAMKLDANRKLPMGMENTGQPKDRKGREW